MKKGNDKEKQAFDDIGTYIRFKVEKYRSASGCDNEMLYQAYLNIFKAWQKVGLEAGFIQ